MSSEEKSAWILLVGRVGAYAIYLVIVLTQLGGGALTERAYVAPLLLSIGGVDRRLDRPRTSSWSAERRRRTSATARSTASARRSARRSS